MRALCCLVRCRPRTERSCRYDEVLPSAWTFFVALEEYQPSQKLSKQRSYELQSKKRMSASVS